LLESYLLVTPIESDAEDLDVKEPLSDSTSTYEKYESMVDAVYKGSNDTF